MRIVHEGCDGPEHLVAAVFSASIELLAETVAGSSGPNRFEPAGFGKPALFRCPACGDGPRPSAWLIDGWRWTCTPCGVTRTRWALERLVIEDPALLLRLGELLRRRELDGGGDEAA